jgi:hypothetical protein
VTEKKPIQGILRKWWASLTQEEQEDVMLDAVQLLIEGEYIHLLEDHDGCYTPYWEATGDKVGEFT